MVSLPKSRDICVPSSKFHPMHRTRSISWGHVPLDCQEFVMRTLSLIPWTMAYHQVRGRAASLSPKSRPKVHLPAQSALCLRRNPLPAACTVRKTHRFLNGGRVPQDGQAGDAIGCSVAASVCPHRGPYPPHTRAEGTSFSRSFVDAFQGHFPSNKPQTRIVYRFSFWENHCTESYLLHRF